MAKHPDVVIVGGGIAGTAVAYFLAREGVEVILLEKDAVGGQASMVGVGMLCPRAEAETPDAPLLPLGRAALERYRTLAEELADEIGAELGLSWPGLLQPAYTEAEAEALRSRIPWQQELGWRVRWLDRAEALKEEPHLAPGIVGALLSEDEGVVDGRKTAHALARAAAAHGARIWVGVKAIGLEIRGERVTGVHTDRGVLEAEYVVLATGAWTGIWEEWLGFGRLPVRPVRGQRLELVDLFPPLTHILYGGPRGYVAPHPDGRVMVGATQEPTEHDLRVTLAGVGFLAAQIPELAPGLAGATFVGASASLRPGSPDGLPLVGFVPGWRRVAVHSGHFRNGILLGPLTGELLAELLLHGRSENPLLTPLDPARFREAREEVGSAGTSA